MSISLRMIQKAPVVFSQYDPSSVISQSELAQAFAAGPRKSDAIHWLWCSYGRAVLADADPCMEANEGAAATVAILSACPMQLRLDVKPLQERTYELKMVYLSETEEGDVFLHFFPFGMCCARRDACRIDLTDFGSEAAAGFIASLFNSYTRIVRLCEKNTGAGLYSS